MSEEKFIFRKSTIKDTGEIFKLYKSVGKIKDGLARDVTEITKGYVESFTLRALKTNSQFVAIDPANAFTIVGEVHCCKLEPKAFNHILSELTIAIAPEYQGKGLGEQLFTAFLHNIASNRADILRVELIVRESNTKAIKLYEKLGFVAEGRLEKRIRTSSNVLEADIPMAWFNPKFRRGE